MFSPVFVVCLSVCLSVTVTLKGGTRWTVFTADLRNYVLMV